MFRLDHLPNQRKDEEVRLFRRRHWFAVAAIGIPLATLTLTPLLIAWFFWDVILTWFAHPVIGPVMTILASMYFLSIWLLSFIEFTDFYLDTWIVTTERIINVEQRGLFHRTASELDLAAVQDTTAEIKGIIQTIFNYGQVYVQTAGEKGRFHFKNVSDPEHIKELVTQLVEEDKKRLSALGAGGHRKIKSNIK